MQTSLSSLHPRINEDYWTPGEGLYIPILTTSPERILVITSLLKDFQVSLLQHASRPSDGFPGLSGLVINGAPYAAMNLCMDLRIPAIVFVSNSPVVSS